MAESTTSKRPTGVTIIAVLILIGVALTLLGISALEPVNAVILGIKVPLNLARVVSFLLALVWLYCGIGFFQLKRDARQLFIWLAIYGIANSLLSTPVVMSAIAEDIPRGARSVFSTSATIGVIITLAFYGLMLFYVVRQKEHFVN